MSKKPYEKSNQHCEFGHYQLDKKASYTITASDKLNNPWYYVYQNRKILLYVDQNGPVKVQYEPPSGILVTRRELGETESKWQVWVEAQELNGGVPVSNFNSPKLDYRMKKPEYTVSFTPAVATYTSKYDGVDIITDIFVPEDKATVCMKTTIVNKSKKTIDFTVTPSLFPYVNIPQMVAWDLPEWYLDTRSYLGEKSLTVHGKMRSPEMDLEKERSVTFNLDYDENAEFEFDLSRFKGTGNFLSPDSVKEKTPFSFKFTEAKNENFFGGMPAVWAARYRCSLNPGESKTYTQVLTVQEAKSYSPEENKYEARYFDEEEYEKILKKTLAFYEKLFTVRKIKTGNEIYDNFINNFAPLEMYWVSSLDRGWPSSMRGVRDASQDFTGMLPLNPEWTRKIILSIFEHQRKSDGWFPRQISTVSREAPHDMRYFSDGGAFLLELVHEYLVMTRDSSILDERLWWLDSDEKSSVFEHILAAVDFYIRPSSIGKNGLCKVWHGDWWDVMDKIGLDGIGETVTVTAQMIYNLKNLSDMLDYLMKIKKLDGSYIKLKEEYLKARERFITAMLKNAYNKLGFFNGYTNDDGKWLFSDCDPDGEDRLYLVSNAWAIIAGLGDENLKHRVLSEIEKRCFKFMGYHTHSTPFLTRIEKAGREGDGNHKSTYPYNHAQSFLVRAACTAGDAELAYKVTRYILPIEEDYAPPALTMAPPFCIANSYSASEKKPHRVQLQYLSGTVSYVLRTVYSYFFGITYGYDGLTLKPSLPRAFGECSAEFSYLGKRFTLLCHPSEEKKFVFNGKYWSKTKYSYEYARNACFIPDLDMKDENVIEIYY